MITRFDVEKLNKSVKQANKILLASHKDCGDATGSVVATMLALRYLDKKADMFLPGPVPDGLRFLPHIEKIMTGINHIDLNQYDLFFCVDAADVYMTGLEEQWARRSLSLITINFDHHLTNPGYGDINVVDKNSSATSVMLYQWFRQAAIPVTREMATCLLTGIFTDTATFSNPGTTSMSLQASADMLVKGANPMKILDKMVNNKSINDLRLWGRALERLSVDEVLGVVATVITQADLKELAVGQEAIEGIANFLSDLSGYKAVLVLKEQDDGTVKGSLRTTRDDVDVAELAKQFGGGGHKKAAGFTIQGKLVETNKGWEVV